MFIISTPKKATLPFLEANKVLPNFMLVALAPEHMYKSFSTDYSQRLKPVLGFSMALSDKRFLISSQKDQLYLPGIFWWGFWVTWSFFKSWVSEILYPKWLLGRMSQQPNLLLFCSWTHMESLVHTQMFTLSQMPFWSLAFYSVPFSLEPSSNT